MIDKVEIVPIFIASKSVHYHVASSLDEFHKIINDIGDDINDKKVVIPPKLKISR